MNLKQKSIIRNRILSRNMAYLKKNKPKQNKKTHFQTLSRFLKINLLIFGVFVSRIYSRSLLISCATIVAFSTRIFRNLDLGIEYILRSKPMELESLGCIVSRLERVVVVRPTYIFSLEIQSSKIVIYLF